MRHKQDNAAVNYQHEFKETKIMCKHEDVWKDCSMNQISLKTSLIWGLAALTAGWILLLQLVVSLSVWIFWLPAVAHLVTHQEVWSLETQTEILILLYKYLYLAYMQYAGLCPECTVKPVFLVASCYQNWEDVNGKMDGPKYWKKTFETVQKISDWGNNAAFSQSYNRFFYFCFIYLN